MLYLYVRVRNWLASDEGATATEYGVLVAFIALALVVGATVLGQELSDFFDRIGTTVRDWDFPG